MAAPSAAPAAVTFTPEPETRRAVLLCKSCGWWWHTFASAELVGDRTQRAWSLNYRCDRCNALRRWGFETGL